MLEPEIETRPWAEQLAIDDVSYREQLAYLYERSPFYRAKLAEAGFASAAAAGGLAEIAQLPLTEKAELKATASPGNPVGAHLCAERAEIVRIYSTSGTTGTPSYIPLTAGDLDNWVTGSARSYAASGVSAGERIVSTYNAGPFVAGRGARQHSTASGCATSRSARATPSAWCWPSTSCGPRPPCSRPPTPPTSSSGRPSGASTCAGRASGACSSRASRAAASRPSARSSRRAGAPASPRRWASATSARRCGASASSRTACTSARAASCTPS